MRRLLFKIGVFAGKSLAKGLSLLGVAALWSVLRLSRLGLLALRLLAYQIGLLLLKVGAGAAGDPNNGRPRKRSSSKKSFACRPGPAHPVRKIKTPRELPHAPDYVPPSLNDLLDFFKGSGVIGNEDVALLSTLAVLRGRSIGIVGASSAGKTATVEPLLALLPENIVYRLGLASNTAPFYECERIPEFAVVFIPELQKANGGRTIIELVKDLSDGKECVRTVTRGKESLTQRIPRARSVLFTLATENPFKLDSELRRRFLLFSVDEGEATTRAVLLDAARKSCAAEESTLSDESRVALKKHIAHCVQVVPDALRFVDPFAHYLMERFPCGSVKLRALGKHYLSLVEGAAFFRFPGRARLTEGPLKGATLVHLEDMMVVHGNALEHLRKMSGNDRRGGKDAAEWKTFAEMDWAECLTAAKKVVFDRFPTVAEQWLSSCEEEYERMGGRPSPAGLHEAVEMDSLSNRIAADVKEAG